MASNFVHLHVHTEYSIVDGLTRIQRLVDAVAQAGMPAVAVTDQSNLFGMVKFYRAAQQAGIKPIIGADVWVNCDSAAGKRTRLVLLCQDLEGYRNLTRLITRSYTHGQADGIPTLEKSWFRDLAGGLIALSPGAEGVVGGILLHGRTGEAETELAHWLTWFPNRFYLGIHRIGREREEELIERSVQLAIVKQVPVVATNAVCFIDADDFEAHETKVCINDGRTLSDPRRPRRYTRQQYLRGPDEMNRLFQDIPEAIDNALLVAKRCNLEMGFGEHHLPNFPVPQDTNIDVWCRRQAREGLWRRLAKRFDPDSPAFEEQCKPYRQRLEAELEVITSMGFAGYFLIVADFVRWAKENGIPVGPGRGSGAGSLVAFSLEITELDPIAYDLLFERFLNPERVSMPDFDIDFCMERRDEVIAYVAQRYGPDRVSQIITHGTMAAKAVVRDVGRVLGYPYGFVDQIAKLIPFDLNMTLERALDEEPALRERYDNEDDVRDLIDLARKLEGLTRNAGRHAGGVVISPEPLTQYMPLYCEQGAGTTVTQFDMSDVEMIGLVKFDFLGLRTLTIIDWALDEVNRSRAARSEPPIDIEAIPLTDAKTFEMIQRAETTAVFQLESRGMKELIKRLKPDSFEDLIALVALFRPGPLQSGMVDDFTDRKHGKARVKYPHPELEPILRPTYGVILYQEQVMQIAQVLAGYTLGAADLLRRAMGKKKPQEMAKQREIFVDGATARGVNRDLAAGIFDLMEKFAGYGFNKSHSAAYALVAYQTAWLKAHYPAQFMAAVLSADMDNAEKIVSLIDECRRMCIEILPPDVNSSQTKFTARGGRAIRYGLGAIKGVGQHASDAIAAQREAGGEFSDLLNLCRRIDLRKANRRVLEALIRAGAMDSLGASRSALMVSLGDVLRAVEQQVRDTSAGQNDLFGLATGTDGGTRCEQTRSTPAFLKAVPEWTEQERLAGEKETLGLYLSGHPIRRYRQELANFTSCPLCELTSGSSRVAGLIVNLRMANSRRGRMAIATLDDDTARTEVVVYSDVLNTFSGNLHKDLLVVVEGVCEPDEFTGDQRIRAQRVLNIEQARAEFVKRLVLRTAASQADGRYVDQLRAILKPYCDGRCPVVLEYRRPDATVRLRLGERWRVQLSDALFERLNAAFGAECITVEY